MPFERERRLIWLHAGEMPSPEAVPQVPDQPETVHEKLVAKHRELQQRMERASALVSAMPTALAQEWNNSLNRAIKNINAEMANNQEEALQLVEHWVAQTGELLNYQDAMRTKQREGLGRFNIELSQDTYYIHIPYSNCGRTATYVEGNAGSYTTFAYQNANNGWKWPVKVKIGSKVTVSVPNRNGCWSKITLEGRFGALNLYTLEAVPDAPPPAELVAERREWNQERSGSSAPAAPTPAKSAESISPVSAVTFAHPDDDAEMHSDDDKFATEDAYGRKKTASLSGKVSDVKTQVSAEPEDRHAEGDSGGSGGSGGGGGRSGGNSPTRRAHPTVAPDASYTSPPASENVVEKDPIEEHLDAVTEQMRVRGMDEKEIRARIQVLRNVARGKTYFPDGADKPEVRNAEYWHENDNGSYVSTGSGVEAIRDLWRSSNGIQCNKYSRFIMIKTLIDSADEKQLKMLDELLTGIAIPNELPSNGMGILFEDLEPKNGVYFTAEELLPGDQIWFENPYMNRLTDEQTDTVSVERGEETVELGSLSVINEQMAAAETKGAVWGTEVNVQTDSSQGTLLCKRDPKHKGALFFKVNGEWCGPADVGLNDRYKGEQGSNLFYAGNGKVMGIYDPRIKTVNTYRRGMCKWNSVLDRDQKKYPEPSVEDFQIKGVRRMKVSWQFVEYIVQQKRALRDLDSAIVGTKQQRKFGPTDNGQQVQF